jgi:Peptidase A4 family
MPDHRPRLHATNLADHYHFELPPEGFQPTRATDEELRLYGLPHRPDPRKFPKAARLWLRCMRRVKRFIAPTLERRSDLIHGRGAALHDVSDTTRIWSGLTITGNAPYISVWGTWTVPAISPRRGREAVSSIWIGLDDNERSLLQAGTDQDCNALGFTVYFPWFEWLPQPTIAITNLSVSPGQSVAVFVGNVEDLPGGNQGLVTFLNYSTGEAAAPILVPIPTTDFNGTVISPPLPGVPSARANWILERPSSVQDGKVTPGLLADYGEASIIEGDAIGTSTDSGKTFASGVFVGENDQGTLHQMLADDGVTVISEASEVPGLKFVYTGS